jgi:hypothetical protein
MPGMPGMASSVQLSRDMPDALRHEPEAYVLVLDAEGRVPVTALVEGLRASRRHGVTASRRHGVTASRRHGVTASRRSVVLRRGNDDTRPAPSIPPEFLTRP